METILILPNTFEQKTNVNGEYGRKLGCHICDVRNVIGARFEAVSQLLN